jgi:hypothetical protein
MLALAFALGPAAATTDAQTTPKPEPKPPTAAQIKQAITTAEQSKQLWATINVCTVKPTGGGSLGVRGEMPTLGFSSTLSMTIQLNLYSTKTKKFVPIAYKTARTTVTPGTFTSGLHQDGAVFPFAADAGLLNATVTFTWSLSGKTIGTTVRTTSGGHLAAIFGKANRFSAAQCKIG